MSRREELGKLVRDTWVAWAREQANAKLTWLLRWDQLDAGQREVDMRIGEAVAADERARTRQMTPHGRSTMRPVQITGGRSPISVRTGRAGTTSLTC
jgi:hypothetical protein